MDYFLKWSYKLQLITVLTISIIFWFSIRIILDTPEPWDSENFSYAYLLAIILAGLFGAIFRENCFIWGWLVIFAQFPIIAYANLPSKYIGVGLFMLFFLSVPAVVAACLCAMVASWQIKSD